MPTQPDENASSTLAINEDSGDGRGFRGNVAQVRKKISVKSGR